MQEETPSSDTLDGVSACWMTTYCLVNVGIGKFRLREARCSLRIGPAHARRRRKRCSAVTLVERERARGFIPLIVVPVITQMTLTRNEAVRDRAADRQPEFV